MCVIAVSTRTYDEPNNTQVFQQKTANIHVKKLYQRDPNQQKVSKDHWSDTEATVKAIWKQFESDL